MYSSSSKGGNVDLSFYKGNPVKACPGNIILHISLTESEATAT
ncbi:MAG: hypothetical protein P8K68_03710 [Algibacter sp.]|nr:hypothetical protein [Algibacter sp.]MDG1729726.1 hypothetical protein [Algibacter sp.]MDG2177880.1 hypothetical protein [Algibacter sp.]